MNYAILGAGALGTILGAHLAKAGHGVTMLARGARAEQLRRDGLRVRGLASIETACQVLTDPAALPPVDVLILATKARGTADALAPIPAAHVGAALSVQNGVAKERFLREKFGADRVIGAMADFSGELHADGIADFTRNVGLPLGGAGAETVAAELAAAGIAARHDTAVESLIWSKFAGWTALMSLAVLSRGGTGWFLADPDLAAITVRLVREAGALAAAEGVALRDGSPMSVATICTGSDADALEAIAQSAAGFRASPGHLMSSLQDFEAGRPLETDETLGDAVRRAEALGIEVPTLRTVLGLVEGAIRMRDGNQRAR